MSLKALLVLLALSCFAGAQASPTPTPTPKSSTGSTSFPDVSLVVGVGSLVNAGKTDYQIQNTNQVFEAQTAGRATPQILTGLAFGLPIPNFRGCTPAKPPTNNPNSKDANKDNPNDSKKDNPSAPVTNSDNDKNKGDKTDKSSITETVPAGMTQTLSVSSTSGGPSSTVTATSPKNAPLTIIVTPDSTTVAAASSEKPKDDAPTPQGSCGWLPTPWQIETSLKFAPNSTDVLNGYVIGLSYSLGKHLSLLGGYSLSPTHEPSPGFINAAVQVVRNNQNLSIYQNFDPNAMLANKNNAFDGFPVLVQNATGATGTPVFLGNPLITHYRGGFIFGVMFPLTNLTDLLNAKKQ